MQSDNFNQFSYRRTWLLIRRDSLIYRNGAIYISLLILSLEIFNLLSAILIYSSNDGFNSLDMLNHSPYEFILPFGGMIIYFITFIYYIGNKMVKNHNIQPPIERMMAPARISEKTFAAFFIVVFAIPAILFLPAFLLHNLFFLFLGLPFIHISWTLLLLGSAGSSFLFYFLVSLDKSLGKSPKSEIYFNGVIFIIFLAPIFIWGYFLINTIGQKSPFFSFPKIDFRAHFGDTYTFWSDDLMALMVQNTELAERLLLIFQGLIVATPLTLIVIFWYAIYLARQRS